MIDGQQEMNEGPTNQSPGESLGILDERSRPKLAGGNRFESRKDPALMLLKACGSSGSVSSAASSCCTLPQMCCVGVFEAPKRVSNTHQTRGSHETVPNVGS